MSPGVVVVDDAEDLRKLIVLALRRDGRLEVLADVGDGKQGIEAVHEHRPAVVLMDISMPVMDGLTASRELRRSYPDLRIAIFTGYGDARLEQQATELGVDAFIEKNTPLSKVADILVELATR